MPSRERHQNELTSPFIPRNILAKVKSLSLDDRYVIALCSPKGLVETGLPLCPSEKKARKPAREIRWKTFSGPVSGRKVQNCRDFQRLLKKLSWISLQP